MRDNLGTLARIYIAAVPGAGATVYLETRLHAGLLGSLLIACTTAIPTMLPGLLWNAAVEHRRCRAREEQCSASRPAHTEAERRSP